MRCIYIKNGPPTANSARFVTDDDGDLSGSVTGQDANGSSVKFRSLSEPTYGVLSFSESGTFSYDGFGWSRTGGVPKIQGNAGPRLLLREPFDADGGEVEITFEFEQLTPSDTLVLSALGFHALFSSNRETGPRCIVSTARLDEALAELASGQGGRSFEGFERGESYTVRLVLNQASGAARVWIGPKRIVSVELPSPRGNVQSASLTFTSIEPVRLLHVKLEGPRE